MLGLPMNLTNASYLIRLRGKTWTECYYRDAAGWLKESCRGRKFRATAEQVLNHLLPALAGVKPGLTVHVEHRDSVSPKRGCPPRSKTGPATKRGSRRDQTAG